MSDPFAAPLVPARRLSVLDAASEAVELVRQRLFPFRLDRWLPLGFVTFLDHCGRSGGGPGGTGRFPGSSPGSSGSGGESAAEAIGSAKEWIGEHMVVIVAVSAIALVVLVTLLAVILWINSRGVFMYLDNVASGRFDVVRPWREHADKSWSYFGWSFGVSLIAFLGVLAMAGLGIWFGIMLFMSGPNPLPILGLITLVLVFIVFVVALNLFSVLLHDFAAPLQMKLAIPCGQALRVAWGLVRANLGTFVVYVLLKIVFAIVSAICGLLAGCFTCCLGFLPVVSHTLLQPLHYFERAWSLCLLRQAGFDLFPVAPPPPYPPEALSPAPPPLPAGG
jgi:hypothetical protein